VLPDVMVGFYDNNIPIRNHDMENKVKYGNDTSMGIESTSPKKYL